MANTLAQNPTSQSYANATSVNKVFAAGGTNPSLYIASVTAEVAATTATGADDQNAGAYDVDVSSTDTSNSGRCHILSKQNTSTGTATITITLGAASHGILKTYEITGAATSAALDTQNSASGADTGRSVSITTGTANCTVIACTSAYPHDLAVDTNYTAGYAAVGVYNNYSMGEYRVDAGAAGGITLTFAEPDTSQRWSMAVAAYKTAAGGAAFIKMVGNNFRLAGAGGLAS